MIFAKTSLRRFAIYLCLSVFLGFSGTVRSQEDLVTLSLDNADIIDLIRWASDLSGRTIILNPNISGSITVIAGDPITTDEAWDVFLSVLQAHRLAIVSDGAAFRVVAAENARQSAIPVEEGANPLTSDIVIRIIRPENLPATSILGLLQPLVPNTSYLSAFAESNILVIADSERNIAKLEQVIAEIDEAGVIDIEIIPLEFATAAEVMATLDTLFPNRNPENATFQMVVDERTNSIILTGDSISREQIRAFIRRLDSPIEGDGNAHVIRIQYADAEEVSTILEGIVTTLQDQNTAQNANQPAISLQVYAELNAIVVIAPPEMLGILRGIAAQLDVPRAQVLVEAIIVEVTEDVANNFGIEWFSSPADISIDEDLVGGFGAYPNALTPLSGEDDGTFSLGSGLSLGYYRGPNLRATLNVLAGESNANILSTPSIMALDNEEAEILVGSSVPFITGSEAREGNTNPFQTIERQDIGVTLAITPRINNDDLVTLEIEQTVESISQAATETADIVTNKREITTTVLIRNTQTLVLGGLIRDEMIESESKVPLLGDIPLFGRAFKSNTVTSVKRNLMVFIRPTILRTTEDADAITEERYNESLNQQVNFENSLDILNRFFILSEPPALPTLETN